jgi:hypothetical protein
MPVPVRIGLSATPLLVDNSSGTPYFRVPHFEEKPAENADARNHARENPSSEDR